MPSEPDTSVAAHARGGTLLHEVVATVEQVAATPSRNAKIDRLAELLAGLGPGEIGPVVGLLTGAPRQGRTGVGWRTIADVSSPGAAKASLTVLEVDHAISGLAAAGGAGSGATRQEILDSLLWRATEPEQRLLVGVLLGEVRMGALAGILTDAVARAAGLPVASVRRAVMLSGSLGQMATLALTGDDLTAVGLRVGTPVLPMLAATARSVADAVALAGRSSVEVKLDGARIQVHRDGGPGGTVRVFTRSLADITDRVPELVEIVGRFPGGSFILDGETLALDEDGAPRAFQDTMSRLGATVAREQLLRPWFFDVLHAHGRDLVDEPLEARRAILTDLVGDYAIEAIETSDPIAAEEFSRSALAAGHEGVVVKGLTAAYVAGRRGKQWLKVKPVHTVDLVVLAAEWGSGRRTGWLSNLHLGARDLSVPLDQPGGLIMVGKTFKGLTDELLHWQTEQLVQRQIRSTRHVVYVRPELVVEIAIDGVQRSTRYPGGLALRFARVKRYRDDKRAQDADSIESLRAML